MGKKAYFIKIKKPMQGCCLCDKCNLRIKDVQDGYKFWNPNPRARDKNICQNCYDVIMHDRKEKWRIWQEKYVALKQGQEGDKDVTEETLE